MRARTVALLLVVAAGTAVMVSGCFGSSRTGDDSETHFWCASSSDCAPRGPGLECIRGACVADAGSGGQATRPEAGLSEAAAPPARDGGADASAPGSKADAGRPPLEAGTVPLDAGPQGLLPPLTLDIHVIGSLRVPQPQNLKVALVWYPRQTPPPALPPPFSCTVGLSAYRVAQLIQPAAMHDLGGGHFTLDITGPPPSAALYPIESRGHNVPKADGQIVAYTDGNGNGTLDFATTTGASPDEVLGVSAPDWNLVFPEPGFVTYLVEYAGGELLEGAVAIAMRPGFSTFVEDGTSISGFGISLVPVTDEIPVLLNRLTTTSSQICSDVCLNDAEPPPPSSGCPATPAGVPKVGTTLCTVSIPDRVPDGFLWRHRTCNGCQCTVEQCSYMRYTAGIITPDWPCGDKASRSDYPEP